MGAVTSLRAVARDLRDRLLRATPEERNALPLWEHEATDAPVVGPVVPTYSAYVPVPVRRNGMGIVVFPGGGYCGHAEHEAGPIGRHLRSLGFAVMVVRYRLSPQYQHPAMLLDAGQAVRIMRQRAQDWAIDRARVGVLGFSAGGHLAAHISTCWREAATGNGGQYARPDFTVLVYPVIRMFGADAHPGCRSALLGANSDETTARTVSPDLRVTSETPPAFIVHGRDDAVIDYRHSEAYADACASAGVAHELHLLTHGPHGFGLGRRGSEAAEWPVRMARWLRRPAGA